jgi:hypothetical protein
MAFIYTDSEKALASAADKNIDSSNPLAAAADVLINLSKDERERVFFRNRRIAQEKLESSYDAIENRYRAEGRVEGKTEGRIEGRVKGRLEGRIEGRVESIVAVAINLISTSLHTKEIAELTGLTCDEIKNIHSLMKHFTHEWNPLKNEIFTLEEMTASDFRVAVISEFIKARNERSVS